MAPFHGWGSTAWRLQSHYKKKGDSFLVTNKSPKISGTHLIDIEKIRGWVDLGVTQWLWTRDLRIENPAISNQGQALALKVAYILKIFWTPGW